MQNQGRGQFTYDVFKAAYDSDPRLQTLVSNFDQNTIELKSDEMDDIDASDAETGGDSVGTMAKRATDLGSL